MIEILSKWGNALSINASQSIIADAIAENEWFTPKEIHLAISAIHEEMLQPKALEEWLKEYEIPTKKQESVLIVMAGNIPLVGFFDLLCVVATGHTALVKPSHKDRTLIEWAISELKEIDPSIPIFIYDGSQQIDRLIATGSDTAARHFKSRYPSTPTLLRGTRHSLAIITKEDDDLSQLSEDIYSYSGLGCRNVSMIFAPRDLNLADLPKGNTHHKHHNNYLRQRALLSMNGSIFTDNGSHCLIDGRDFSNEISQITIYRYDSITEVEQWIATHDNEIQCIVANNNTIEHPRRVNFGRAQHPSLIEYADGIDTMKFLIN